MSATPEETAATTEEVPQAPDGSAEAPKSAESAPAVTDADENTHAVKGVEKRIDELTRHRREAERDRDYWREVAIRSQHQPQYREPQPEPQQPVAAKTLDDFGGDQSKFLEHLVAETERKVEARFRQAEESRVREAAQARRDDFRNVVSEYAEKNSISDVENVFKQPSEGGPNISPEMAETILDSENGAAIAVYLAKNRSVADQIARLPPLQQARELGRIEANLSEKAKAPAVSKAPPPAPTLVASDPAVERDPDKMSDDEWLKWRNKQLARQRREGRAS